MRKLIGFGKLFHGSAKEAEVRKDNVQMETLPGLGVIQTTEGGKRKATIVTPRGGFFSVVITQETEKKTSL